MSNKSINDYIRKQAGYTVPDNRDPKPPRPTANAGRGTQTTPARKPTMNDLIRIAAGR